MTAHDDAAISPQQVSIVLVHGACHGPWCWEPVINPLQDRGWSVVAVELPLTSLRADAAVVRNAVRQQKTSGHAVLLVGHSYGGVVVTDAGHEADALAYCASTLPEAGQSAADLVPFIQTPQLTASLSMSDDGSSATLLPDLAVPAFYNRTPPDVAARAIARLRPMQVQALDEAVGPPAWQQVPSTYIGCADDYALATSYQRQLAQLLDEAVEFDCDHSLFYSATDQLVDRLDVLASRLSSRSTGLVPIASATPRRKDGR